MKDILIVEDGNKERERLRELFTAAGYSLFASENVSDAENELLTNSFRLAILDIGLSDKSGSYLFNQIKNHKKVSNIIIFTGNPSVHLKQRFIEEGAADYIVKGSADAENSNFIRRVKELIGEPLKLEIKGIALEEFLDKYASSASRALFYDLENKLPRCSNCSCTDYVVIFDHINQMPPEISAKVVCSNCRTVMDPQIG